MLCAIEVNILVVYRHFAQTETNSHLEDSYKNYLSLILVFRQNNLLRQSRLQEINGVFNAEETAHINSLLILVKHSSAAINVLMQRRLNFRQFKKITSKFPGVKLDRHRFYILVKPIAKRLCEF